MPGLFGYFRKVPDRSDQGPAFLERMQRTLLHESWYETVPWYRDQVAGIGLVRLPHSQEEDVFFDRERGQVVAWEGSLHGLSLPPEPEPRAAAGEGLTRRLSRLAAHRGRELGQHLKGEFNLLVYQPGQSRLLIVNDRFGYRNLYWAETAEALVFATEVKAVLAHPGVDTRPDELALADFLNLGYLFGCKTFFQGVKLLEPGTVLEASLRPEWQAGRSTYWDLRFAEQPCGLEERIEEGHALFGAGVKRRLSGKRRVFIPLSGGLDSRILAEAASRAADPADLVLKTWGADGNCLDNLLARQVARTLGLRNHAFLRLGPEFITRYSPKQIWLTDGMIRGTSSQQLFILERAGREMDLWLNGILGGNYTFGTSNVYEDDEIREPLTPLELEEHAYRRYRSEWGLFQSPWAERVLREDLAAGLDERVRASIHEAARPSLQSNPLLCDQKVHFKHLNMSRRLMNNVAVHKFYVEDQKAFYDYDLLDFFLALPARLRTRHRLYRALVRKKLPALADIPWQSTLLPLDERRSARTVVWEFEERFKRFFNKRAGGRLELARRKEYLDFNLWFRRNAAFRDYLTGTLLEKRSLGRGIYREAGVRWLFEMEMRGGNLMGQIMVLYSYEMFCRQFLDHDLSAVEQVRLGPYR